MRVKFEIVLEARIDLEGTLDKRLGVPSLDLGHAAAEKFLANADRGLDESTHARDLIDLAFMAAHYGPTALFAGLRLAETAYGAAIREQLKAALAGLQTHTRGLTRHAAALGIEDLPSLRAGLKALSTLAKRQ